jgi:hypothetical protein
MNTKISRAHFTDAKFLLLVAARRHRVAILPFCCTLFLAQIFNLKKKKKKKMRQIKFRNRELPDLNNRKSFKKTILMTTCLETPGYSNIHEKHWAALYILGEMPNINHLQLVRLKAKTVIFWWI